MDGLRFLRLLEGSSFPAPLVEGDRLLLFDLEYFSRLTTSRDDDGERPFLDFDGLLPLLRVLLLSFPAVSESSIAPASVSILVSVSFSASADFA